jgi:hypothetical protein
MFGLDTPTIRAIDVVVIDVSIFTGIGVIRAAFGHIRLL